MEEAERDAQAVYGLLLEEKLEAFFLPFRNELHVYKPHDLQHVSRRDLHRIGLLSGPDLKRFEKVIERVNRSGGIKDLLQKVFVKQKAKHHSTTLTGTVSPTTTTINFLEHFERPEIIKTGDVEMKEILGRGQFGEVHKGQWTRKINGQDHLITVALKSLRDESGNSLMKEVSVLSTLDQHHTNIIKFYGLIIGEDGVVHMVTEFAEQGSLLERLTNGDILSVSTLCQFAVQIAAGMDYLENKGLVHRDLAARNILVTAHNQVKISDFGLSKCVGKGKEWVMSGNEVLPVRWLAPECLLQGKFTSASDVWSFGVTLWEMFSFGAHPWEDLKSLQVIEELKQGNVLHEPAHCPQRIYKIVMVKCWTYEPDERPKFGDLRAHLVSLHPTTACATDMFNDAGMLQFEEGDLITAIKQIEDSPVLWLGQNERTCEIGHFYKSYTKPMMSKIPFAATFENTNVKERNEYAYTDLPPKTEVPSRTQSELPAGRFSPSSVRVKALGGQKVIQRSNSTPGVQHLEPTERKESPLPQESPLIEESSKAAIEREILDRNHLEETGGIEEPYHDNLHDTHCPVSPLSRQSSIYVAMTNDTDDEASNVSVQRMPSFYVSMSPENVINEKLSSSLGSNVEDGEDSVFDDNTETSYKVDTSGQEITDKESLKINEVRQNVTDTAVKLRPVPLPRKKKIYSTVTESSVQHENDQRVSSDSSNTMALQQKPVPPPRPRSQTVASLTTKGLSSSLPDKAASDSIDVTESNFPRKDFECDNHEARKDNGKDEPKVRSIGAIPEIPESFTDRFVSKLRSQTIDFSQLKDPFSPFRTEDEKQKMAVVKSDSLEDPFAKLENFNNSSAFTENPFENDEVETFETSVTFGDEVNSPAKSELGFPIDGRFENKASGSSEDKARDGRSGSEDTQAATFNLPSPDYPLSPLSPKRDNEKPVFSEPFLGASERSVRVDELSVTNTTTSVTVSEPSVKKKSEKHEKRRRNKSDKTRPVITAPDYPMDSLKQEELFGFTNPNFISASKEALDSNTVNFDGILHQSQGNFHLDSQNLAAFRNEEVSNFPVNSNVDFDSPEREYLTNNTSTENYYDRLWDARSLKRNDRSTNEDRFTNSLPSNPSEEDVENRANNDIQGDNKPPENLQPPKTPLGKTVSIDSATSLAKAREVHPFKKGWREQERPRSLNDPVSHLPGFHGESERDAERDNKEDVDMTESSKEMKGTRKIFRFRPKSKKEKEKEKVREHLKEHKIFESIATLKGFVPGATEPECMHVLEVSKGNIKEAVKILKIRRLVALGLELSVDDCRAKLESCQWDLEVIEKQSKVDYLLGQYPHVSKKDIEIVLNDSNWDVESVIHKLRVRVYYEDCKRLGISELHAIEKLRICSENVDEAIQLLKVDKVANITLKSQEYCRKTLEHCQWKVERAITYIVNN